MTAIIEKPHSAGVRTQPAGRETLPSRSAELEGFNLYVTHTDSVTSVQALLAALSTPPVQGADEDPEWIRLEATHSLELPAVAQFRLAPGAWVIIGFDDVGRSSLPTQVKLSAAEVDRVELDFERSVGVTGSVIDGYSGRPLSGASLRVSSVIGAGCERTVSGGTFEWGDGRTDAGGTFLLHVGTCSRLRLAVSAEGYLSDSLPVEIGVTEQVDLGSCSLIPTTELCVQLVGGETSEYASFRLKAPWLNESVAFDADGRASVRCDRQNTRPSIHLLHPEGSILLVQIAGRPEEVNPVVIDLHDSCAIQVEVVGAGATRSSLMFQVHLNGERGRVYEWNAPLDGGVGVVSGLAPGDLVVSLVDNLETGTEWIESKALHLEAGQSEIIRFDTDVEMVTALVRDSQGKPLPGVLIGLKLSSTRSGWEPTVTTNSDGECRLPRCQASEFFALGYSPSDDADFVDLRVSADLAVAKRIEIVLGAVEEYSVDVVSNGSPRPWGAIDFLGGVSGTYLRFSALNQIGSTGTVRFFAGSNVAVKIGDPLLFEEGGVFPIQPGRNVIEVHETGVLEFHGLDDLSLEALSVEFEPKSGVLGEWVRGGRVVRQVIADGIDRFVRYSPIPLGTYAWKSLPGHTGTVALVRSGESVSVDVR